MWQFTNPILRKVFLNFPTSRQTAVSQLYAEDILLLNAVECVNWEDSHYQFIVCEGCGIVGCQSQGWVDIRRTESLAIMMPAFEKIDQAPKSMEDEYLPPLSLIKKGAAYLSREVYERTLVSLAKFPAFDSLSPLSAWEASKLFQFEAPNHVLSDVLQPPTLLPDIILTSSTGSHIEQTKELIAVIDELFHQDPSITLRRVTKSDQVISFSLDLARFPQWKAISHDGIQYSLYLEPGFIIEL